MSNYYQNYVRPFVIGIGFCIIIGIIILFKLSTYYTAGIFTIFEVVGIMLIVILMLTRMWDRYFGKTYKLLRVVSGWDLLSIGEQNTNIEKQIIGNLNNYANKVIERINQIEKSISSQTGTVYKKIDRHNRLLTSSTVQDILKSFESSNDNMKHLAEISKDQLNYLSQHHKRLEEYTRDIKVWTVQSQENYLVQTKQLDSNINGLKEMHTTIEKNVSLISKTETDRSKFLEDYNRQIKEGGDILVTVGNNMKENLQSTVFDLKNKSNTIESSINFIIGSLDNSCSKILETSTGLTTSLNTAGDKFSTLESNLKGLLNYSEDKIIKKGNSLSELLASLTNDINDKGKLFETLIYKIKMSGKDLNNTLTPLLNNMSRYISRHEKNRSMANSNLDMRGAKIDLTPKVERKKEENKLRVKKTLLDLTPPFKDKLERHREAFLVSLIDIMRLYRIRDITGLKDKVSTYLGPDDIKYFADKILTRGQDQDQVREYIVAGDLYYQSLKGQKDRTNFLASNDGIFYIMLKCIVKIV
ncbi:MAG: hypothetical protein JJV93_00160 [Alphaproteobacteria bacterium]|nr:hypothetical protein [Alphaproteobacteria bacterium]